jgi:hypothetical protein
VADRVRVKIPLAATSIMDWKAEHILNINTKCAEELKQSAKDIIQVYPDRDAIATASILKRHFRSDRQELYCTTVSSSGDESSESVVAGLRERVES